MNNRLLEIRAQKALLEKEEKEILNSERSEVLEAVKKQIAEYQFTAKELGVATIKKRSSNSESSQQDKPAPIPKYRDPKDPNKTWAGGRGKKPKFVLEHLAAGGKLEDLLIK